MLDEYGRSDFDALQERARRRCWYSGAQPVAYCIFDLLVDRGKDIAGQPLIKRKAALDRMLKVPLPNLLKVGFVEEGAHRLFDEAVPAAETRGVDREATDQRISAWSPVGRLG